MVVELTIPGDPVPLERHRDAKGGGKYLPARSQVFRDTIGTAWMVEGRPRLEGWLAIGAVRFVYARPTSHSHRDGRLRDDAPAFPPVGDLTNLLKAVEDALQDQRDGSRLMYADDAAIVRIDGPVERVYADRGEEPRTEIEIRELG